MGKIMRIDEILDSVSVTHRFDKEELIFLNTSDVYEGKILSDKYFKVSELKGQAKKTIKKDDILFSEIRPKNRRYAFVEIDDTEDYVVSTKLMVLRNKSKEVLTKYIYYFLTYSGTLDYLQMRAENRIGSFPQITFDVLRPILVNIPAPKEQERIVDIISALDARIEINHKINADLEAMARTLYNYWFVQFDFPDKKGRPYKSSGGRMVHDDQLKKDIPEGWDVKRLGEWIYHDKSGDWGKESPEGNYQLQVACIRGADINGLNGDGEVKAPTRFILEKNAHKLLESHDLIVEISGGSPTQSTGRLGFVTEATLERFELPLICSNFCKAVSLKNKNYLFNFVHLWNRLYDSGVLFGYEGKTSGIKNLLFESFVGSYLTVYPPAPLAQKFYERMLPVHNQQQLILKQNAELTKLRDWLLPLLMNGQVNIGEGPAYKKKAVGYGR